MFDRIDIKRVAQYSTRTHCQVIGLGRALDLILTGREVSAEEALSIGLANRVVEEGKGTVLYRYGSRGVR